MNAAETPHESDERLREALLATLAVSRRGWGVRASVLCVCTLPVILMLDMPQLFIWLAALIVWDGLIVRALERGWVIPCIETDLRAARLRRGSMVLAGFTLTQGLPLLAWSTGTSFGAVVGVAWVISAAMQLFIYYSRDRLLLAAGAAPILLCALTAPALHAGITGESIVTSMFVLFVLFGGAAFVGRSDKLIAKAADESAARNAAEAANEAKTRFIANMHQELRTPLNAIIGYSELLRETAQDESRNHDVDDLDRVLSAARQQLDLMNDLIAFSELQDGRVEIEFEDFDAGALAREVAEGLRTAIEAKGNCFTVDLSADLAGAHNDPQKLRQCLEHLLQNAARTTRGGSVALRGRRESGQAGDWLAFTVEDTGQGIAPERLPRVFEPLGQAERSSTGFNSAGLGLAITARLARLLGGDVTVHSMIGRGSSFSLRVPARAPAALAGDAVLELRLRA